jgi:hypothetical protein
MDTQVNSDTLVATRVCTRPTPRDDKQRSESQSGRTSFLVASLFVDRADIARREEKGKETASRGNRRGKLNGRAAIARRARVTHGRDWSRFCARCSENENDRRSRMIYRARFTKVFLQTVGLDFNSTRVMYYFIILLLYLCSPISRDATLAFFPSPVNLVMFPIKRDISKHASVRAYDCLK